MFNKFAVLFLLGFMSQAHAQEIILLKAAGASPVEFAETAKNTKDLKTYMSLEIAKIQNNSSQEEKLFSLGEQLNKPASEVIQEIESIHKSSSLTEVSLNFLKDLSDKMLAGALKSSDRIYFQNLFCQSQALAVEPVSDFCQTSKVNLMTIRRQWPQAEVLMIESKAIVLDAQDASPEILPLSKYHWTLVSNSAQSVSFFGTYEQFVQQRFSMENLIDGNCEAFTNHVDDFQVASRALVFFSKDCTKRLQRPVQKTSFAVWFEENKKWVYPVGGLLLGGAIFAMQGKTLVIDKP